MKEILLLNPSKKRKKRATKKRATKKRATKKRAKRTRKTVTRMTTVTKRNPARKRAARKGVSMPKKKRAKRRRNPSSTRRRRAGTRARNAFGGLNFKSALKNIPLNTLGMFAAKWAAKRFGEAATETDPASWNYASYLKGAAGAAGAGFIMNMIKPGTGQRILEGGMSLMLYKLVQNELIAGSTFWSGQLGADEGYQPGDVETDSAGEPYILGYDNNWYPMDGADDYRMDEGGMYGGQLVKPGPLGDALLPPGPLGASETTDAMFKASLLRR
jgi:hypothetical protein